MRQPQQQNRRGRGRGRKPQNPLQRGYESNGPDVKIRGNAAHIAEKYITLARDALSSGDTVMAENYLQHAEHYNRIIAAAQQQNEAQGERQQHANGNQQQQRNRRGANGSDEGDRAPDAGEDGETQNTRADGDQPERAERSKPAAKKPAAKSSDAGADAANGAADASADAEEAPKPRRRRTPRAKMPPQEAASEGESGPVRLGDMPMDEAAG
ncbi:MAG: DUF4167 domain-containing protein [Pseudomonadota bacterium]